MASSEHHHIIDIQLHFNNLIGSNLRSCSQGLILLLCFIATLILVPSLFLCIHFCRRLLSQLIQPSTTTTSMVVISPLPQHDHMLPSSTTMCLSLSNYMVGGAAGFENNKKECCICLSLFQDDNEKKVKVLTECQHVYHSECLDMWLSARPSCPLCRASLHVSDQFSEQINSPC